MPAQTFTRCFIGLGSNLADPLRQLRQAATALSAMPESRLTTISSIYQSHPLGPADQPDYLNAVAMLDTRLAPLVLLDALQAIELQQGRVRLQHWGPRTLDLDLLLYGAETIDLPRLQVPHAEMQRRNFVLIPLAELAPELVLPDGTALQDCLRACADEGLVKLRSDWLT